MDLIIKYVLKDMIPGKTYIIDNFRGKFGVNYITIMALIFLFIFSNISWMLHFYLKWDYVLPLGLSLLPFWSRQSGYVFTGPSLSSRFHICVIPGAKKL